MNQHVKRECDRCEATIVDSIHDRPNPFQVVIPEQSEDDQQVNYEVFERVLCRECESALLDWIDNPDVDRSEQVDMPYVERTVRGLREIATDLDGVADELEDEADGRD